MRHVLLMALVVGCYRPIPPEGVACNPSGGCPQTLSCIDGVCVSSPPGVDAEVDAARTPQLVAVTTSSTSKTQALHVSIPQVTAGDLLIVAFAIHDATMVTSVVDDEGAALTSAGARAEMASTGSELWYAANSEATTGVTITMAGISGFDVWVVELSGIATLDTIADACLSYPPLVVQASTMTSTPNELVFGVTMLAYPAFISTGEPPFTPLPVLSGNGAAYYIASQPGSYGPSWLVGMGAGMTAMTCASTVAFLPAP